MALVALLAILLVPNESRANLATNGSFENPDIFNCCGTANYLTSGSKKLPGWTVVGTRIQFIDGVDLGTGYAASDGRQWINVTGVIGYGIGVLSDAIPTEVGQTYGLTFDLAGRYGYGNASVSVRINNSAPSVFSSTYHLTPRFHMDWHNHSLE